MKLEMRRPAPVVSSKPSATWLTIRDGRSQPRRGVSVRPSVLSEETRLVLDALIDGMIPKIRADAIDKPVANAST
jgi:hypothetical protein